jgi:hypothetical protein
LGLYYMYCLLLGLSAPNDGDPNSPDTPLAPFWLTEL